MNKELSGFNLPELDNWSNIRLGVVSEQNPVKKAIVPNLPIEIISTDDRELALTMAKGRVKLSLQEKHTILTTNQQSPAIIAELHASSCYLLLTIGSTGQAALLHDQWFNLSGKVTRYKQFLEENFIKEEMITLVAGLRGNDKSNAAQLEFINKILTGTSTVYRLLMDEGKQLELHRASKVDGLAQGPSGLIYIPADLAVDHLPMVFAVAPNLAGSTEAEHQLFDPLSWREI